MTEQFILKKYSQLPENLKKEFLVFKDQNQQQGKQQKPEKKKS